MIRAAALNHHRPLPLIHTTITTSNYNRFTSALPSSSYKFNKTPISFSTSFSPLLHCSSLSSPSPSPVEEEEKNLEQKYIQPLIFTLCLQVLKTLIMGRIILWWREICKVCQFCSRSSTFGLLCRLAFLFLCTVWAQAFYLRSSNLSTTVHFELLALLVGILCTWFYQDWILVGYGIALVCAVCAGCRAWFPKLPPEAL